MSKIDNGEWGLYSGPDTGPGIAANRRAPAMTSGRDALGEATNEVFPGLHAGPDPTPDRCAPAHLVGVVQAVPQ